MTFNHQQVDSDLIHYAAMPVEALAQVTDEALDEYEKIYSEYAIAQKQDVVTATEIADRINTDVKTLFGSYSKQHKYLERNLRCSEDLVSTHGSKYPDPSDIRRKVEQARKCFDVSALHAANTNGGVDDVTMEQQNEAITYLLGNDFQFGSDFTVYNAHEIAVAHGFEKVLSLKNEDIPFEFTEIESDKCEECNTKSIQISARQYIENKNVSCGCGCEDYRGSIIFDGTNVKVRVGNESE